MKKIVITALLILAAVTSVFATAEAEETGAPERLVIWSFFEGAPKVAADYYAEQTGVEVDFIISGWTDYQAKLATSLGTSEEPDLVLLESSFVTNFFAGDYFYDLDEVWGGNAAYEGYLANTASQTVDKGAFNDTMFGIGWEASAWVYWYREDIARELYGINSVEEMEAVLAAGPTQGFLDLQALKAPGNDGVKEIGNAARWVSLILEHTDTPLVENGTLELQDNFYQAMEDGRELSDRGVFYTYGNDQQMEPGFLDGSILGVIAGSWYGDSIRRLEQDGRWRIAALPISIASGGTWAAVPKVGGNPDAAYEYLSMTLMNEDYLLENIGDFGNFVANRNVMASLLAGTDGVDTYFGGQDLSSKFNEVANSPNMRFFERSIFFNAAAGPLTSAVESYIWNNSFDTIDEAIDDAFSQIESTVPDLTLIK